ncbi:DUF302 domain-containing protein [Candidatus Methylospira mobilis]|uniref:DUF302 domain-containing protein n=1 Tax=Candidatus Methylospira mobilis TaxID=1808979 RepID=A0A5Q0BGK9_9GAMM|nr:DUF302 domain-containing protein [Candidatus Methylospira mobilis]QFY41314.1 DUF302 domain-containing protein [Candidatus Methylospira mobilis]WNV05461.1 DUF302 domain-containing protein [Candidatus Methylospira mobilis]
MPRQGNVLYQFIVLCQAFVINGCAPYPSAATAPSWYQAESFKPYADVLAELELAIAEHNYRITGHNHIGSVIRTREAIPFPDYDTLQFCNLTQAREMLEISPAAVAYMPCNVAVRSENGKVMVTTHLLPTDTENEKLNAFFREINRQLKQIVDFAVEK